ncbi:MAG: cell entry protein [Myxococcales bacterium]|nr:cell entry protein [Myxococcales bacterium]
MGLMFKVASGIHVTLFRLTGGRIGSAMRGQKIMLLTTTGNKSGKERTVPIMCFEDGGRRFVVASAAGSTQHPAWFKNLEKTPAVKAELRGERYTGQAAVLSGEERDRMYKKISAVAPGFAEYEKKTGGRVIPVVEIKRA